MPLQSRQCQAGMRCPHHSCREMHQSLMFAALAVADAVAMGLRLDEQSLGLQICKDALAALIAIEPPVRPGVLVAGRVGVEDV